MRTQVASYAGRRQSSGISIGIFDLTTKTRLASFGFCLGLGSVLTVIGPIILCL